MNVSNKKRRREAQSGVRVASSQQQDLLVAQINLNGSTARSSSRLASKPTSTMSVPRAQQQLLTRPIMMSKEEPTPPADSFLSAAPSGATLHVED